MDIQVLQRCNLFGLFYKTAHSGYCRVEKYVSALKLSRISPFAKDEYLFFIKLSMFPAFTQHHCCLKVVVVYSLVFYCLFFILYLD